MPDPYFSPSADPDRTAVRSVSINDPITVDVTADSTDPRSSDSPAGAPLIPGYRVTAEIARGGMGRVFAAVDLTLDRDVAIKTLLPGADPTRFVTESKITAKLPHPGIPPVYALGELADGTPFLAMKLIHGRTLAEQLKARPRPAHDLPRFVQIFEQIAQAVGFAHSRGVIHRDLKPLNVMVGEFGEVQVMDWGLARAQASRERERPEDSSPPVAHAPGSPDNLTRAGAVMGTPGYMPPEQARGEAVDARADVFALGSTLAAVLTGRPAFVGSTAGETIQKAAKADLSDVFARLDSCGADAELVALAKRCLSADRDARPADGRAVADEVRAYRAGVEARLRQAETERAAAVVREGEQRKRRRLVQWASGIAIGLLLAGVTGTAIGMIAAQHQEGIAKGETAAKEQARGEAVESRDELWDGLDVMTSDITGDSLSTQKDVTPEQQKFLSQVLPLFVKLQTKAGEDRQSRERTVRAAARVAAIEFRLGNLAAAETSGRVALEHAKAVAADFPETEARRTVAKQHNNLGWTLQRLGRAEEAEAEYRESLRLLEGLVAEHPNEVKVRTGLVYTRSNLGGLLTTVSRPAEAEAEYRAALDLVEQLAIEHPTDPMFRRLLGAGRQHVGIILADRGNTEEAEGFVRRGVGVFRKSVTEPTARPEDRHDLAKSLTNLGILLARLGKPSDGEYREALGILEKITAEFPGVPEYRRSKAEAHAHLGVNLERAGKLADAEGEFRAAVETQAKLVADRPHVPGYRGDLARYHQQLAGVLVVQKKRGPAEENLRAAVELLERVAADHRTETEYRVQLGKCYSDCAWCIYQVGGRVSDALERSTQAIDTLRPIHEAMPLDVRAKQFLRSAYWNRAVAHDRLNKPADAVGDWDRAVELTPNGVDSFLRASRANSKANAGRWADAVAEVDELRTRTGWTATQLFDFATIYGAATFTLSGEKREFTDRAMELLRKAVDAGFSDASRLKNNAALSPLSERDDFKKLLADLEKKFPPQREVLPPPRRE